MPSRSSKLRCARNPLLVLAGIALVVAGCSTDASRWEKTRALNTRAGYTEFVAKYPASPHAGEATLLLRGLQCDEDWQKACAANTAAAYIAFATQYPDSQAARPVDAKLLAVIDPGDPALAQFEAAKQKRMYFTMKSFVEACTSPAVKYLAEREFLRYRTFDAVQDTFVSIEELTSRFHYDGARVFWKWDPQAVAALMTSNGSMFVLANEVDSPAHGLAFSFGFDGKQVGKFCLGNLPIEGSITSTTRGSRC